MCTKISLQNVFEDVFVGMPVNFFYKYMCFCSSLCMLKPLLLYMYECTCSICMYLDVCTHVQIYLFMCEYLRM